MVHYAYMMSSLRAGPLRVVHTGQSGPSRVCQKCIVVCVEENTGENALSLSVSYYIVSSHVCVRAGVRKWVKTVSP